jgi:hypothetical protein
MSANLLLDRGGMWRCGDPVAVLVDCQLGRLAFASGVVPPTVAPPCMTFIRRIDLSHLLVALFSVAGITAVYATWLGVTNHTTVAVSYLLVVLFVAASSPLWIAILTSIVAMLAFNSFSLPLGRSRLRILKTDRAVRVPGGQSGW